MNKRKLYWLEYSFEGNEFVATPFRVAGFEVKHGGWAPEPNGAKFLLRNLVPIIIDWSPDIIAFWLMGKSMFDSVSEPEELAEACKLIRRKLTQVKIMVFINNPNVPTYDQQLYDYYSSWPVQAKAHVKIAAQLLGEEIGKIDGIKYYLKQNGRWDFRNPPANSSFGYSDAYGYFETLPKTRILDIKDNSPVWVRNNILARIPTTIKFMFKEKSVWQSGLSTFELQSLSDVIKSSQPDHQNLLALNDTLLEIESSLIGEVITDIKTTGNWKVFIAEHMSYESFPVRFFDDVVYEKNKIDPYIMP